MSVDATNAKPVLIFTQSYSEARRVADRLGLGRRQWTVADDRYKLMGCNSINYRIVEIPGFERNRFASEARELWRERESRYGKSEVIPCPT